MIKRYDITCEYNWTACEDQIKEEESADGHWVKFKDVAELQQKLDAMTKKHADLCAWSTVREIKCNDLVNAAQAVIDRWDSPKWKDQAHTGEYIHALLT